MSQRCNVISRLELRQGMVMEDRKKKLKVGPSCPLSCALCLSFPAVTQLFVRQSAFPNTLIFRNCRLAITSHRPHMSGSTNASSSWPSCPQSRPACQPHCLHTGSPCRLADIHVITLFTGAALSIFATRPAESQVRPRSLSSQSLPDVEELFSAKMPKSSAEVRRVFIRDIKEDEGVGQQEQQGDKRDDKGRK